MRHAADRSLGTGTTNGATNEQAPATPPQAIYLKDYQPPAYTVPAVSLSFKLFDDYAEIENSLTLVPRDQAMTPIVLDGEALQLISITRDGVLLSADQYQVTDTHLTLPGAQDAVELVIITRVKPQENTRLEGLYRSSGNFCTQCEAEGFRRITYYPDRPDVLARFVTRIEADKTSCPVLLGNGNPVASGDIDGGRHYAVWDDPHPKPCYLFALVAGQLTEVTDRFTTMSGKTVRLGIFVEPGNEDKTAHAMKALKDSMRWDEEAYGREYDLDVFNIVAVGDFNMGAMENKGLNIFNTKYVLASDRTATDQDYEGVESVIAHEYFHNWSGNRVTCRDWFQLTLKEGFTVFRDQQFSADQNDAAVKRINDVQTLRAAQFPEDAGPLAHPIQPDSYIEINNFYTATVYEKGAEVIRMMHTLIGDDAFRAGTDLYFERHDGEAATCEDFVRAIEDACGHDFSQFRRWYHQPGTPKVTASGAFDAGAGTYTLTIRQANPKATPTAGTNAEPLMIPIQLGLIGQDGQPLPLHIQGMTDPDDDTIVEGVLCLTEPEQSFVFGNLTERPIPSLFRGFSAPITLDFDLSDQELTVLASHDTDHFNRWEAKQILATRLMLASIRDTDADIATPASLIDLFTAILADDQLPDRFRALMLQLPSEHYLAQQLDVIDPERIYAVRHHIQQNLATRFAPNWAVLYDRLGENAAPEPTAEQIGRRSLRNTVLSYLAETNEGQALASKQYAEADNMTDQLAALGLLVDHGGAAAQAALDDFYQRFETEDLVIDKWFAIQARSSHEQTLKRVKALTKHAAFKLTNPNRLRSLIGVFAAGNQRYFHSADGAGYRLLIDTVITLNGLNPQTAARLLGPMRQWRRFEPTRREAMASELRRLLETPDLSRDVFEVASKSLKD